jgi:hypothetical protein
VHDPSALHDEQRVLGRILSGEDAGAIRSCDFQENCVMVPWRPPLVTRPREDLHDE